MHRHLARVRRVEEGKWWEDVDVEEERRVDDGPIVSRYPRWHRLDNLNLTDTEKDIDKWLCNNNSV